ncbi:hypothetical protein BGX38DRAFT_1162182 [Terfezia claveryi]|nr:hypothetical protein BGX38DRAFT_1162182 [Terfezia claveryi]
MRSQFCFHIIPVILSCILQSTIWLERLFGVKKHWRRFLIGSRVQLSREGEESARMRSGECGVLFLSRRFGRVINDTPQSRGY